MENQNSTNQPNFKDGDKLLFHFTHISNLVTNFSESQSDFVKCLNTKLKEGYLNSSLEKRVVNKFLLWKNIQLHLELCPYEKLNLELYQQFDEVAHINCYYLDSFINSLLISIKNSTLANKIFRSINIRTSLQKLLEHILQKILVWRIQFYDFSQIMTKMFESQNKNLIEQIESFAEINVDEFENFMFPSAFAIADFYSQIRDQQLQRKVVFQLDWASNQNSFQFLDLINNLLKGQNNIQNAQIDQNEKLTKGYKMIVSFYENKGNQRYPQTLNTLKEKSILECLNFGIQQISIQEFLDETNQRSQQYIINESSNQIIEILD